MPKLCGYITFLIHSLHAIMHMYDSLTHCVYVCLLNVHVRVSHTHTHALSVCMRVSCAHTTYTHTHLYVCVYLPYIHVGLSTYAFKFLISSCSILSFFKMSFFSTRPPGMLRLPEAQSSFALQRFNVQVPFPVSLMNPTIHKRPVRPCPRPPCGLLPLHREPLLRRDVRVLL
jgi:hypothetical protein